MDLFKYFNGCYFLLSIFLYWISFQNLKILESQLWSATERLVDNLHDIMLSLLKSCRHETLTWLGSCLDKNAARGRLSALDTLSLDTLSCVSDGFMLNLCGVLLRLSQPFSFKQSPKILKIDPTFAAAKVSECEDLIWSKNLLSSFNSTLIVLSYHKIM